MSTFIRAATVCGLIHTTVLVGCARQPSVTLVAPTRSTQPAAAGAAPRDSELAVVEEIRQMIAVTTRRGSRRTTC